jgi:serine/threonine-protein kinase HipA
MALWANLRAPQVTSCSSPSRRLNLRQALRIPFLSAMSMLGAGDNEDYSYIEIAEAIRRDGAAPKQDLAELWRRLAFSILISNTDDHLRNHGFLFRQS